jgi:hypothetical protein
MHENRVLYGLPTLSGLAIAFVLLGPGARRSVEAARVYGVPVVGAVRYAVRVETVRRFGDLEAPQGGAVELVWNAGGDALGVTAANANGDGWTELAGEFSSPLPETAELVVRRGSTMLAQGTVRARPRLATVPSRRCESSRSEDGTLEVCVLRGVAVPESPEQVTVTWKTAAGADQTRAALELTATGGELQKLRSSPGAVCDARGCVETFIYSLVARAPTVSLDAELRRGARRVSYHGELPLQLGGIWLDPASRRDGRVTLRSAGPHDVAYVSLLTEGGRSWGGIVPLSAEPNGFSRATFATPSFPAFADPSATLVVSSDPTEPPGRVVAWPMGSNERVDAVPVALLVDGIPFAVAREEQRRTAIRLPVAGVVGMSALALLAVFVRRVTSARHRLEAHLASQGQSRALSDRRWGLVPLVLAALAVAFAALALVAAYG